MSDPHPDTLSTQSDLQLYIGQVRDRIQDKVACRQSNLDAEQCRPSEQFFRKLDSNLKKNTTFVKKLKSITESQQESLVRDFEALNLSKYVAEIASNLSEGKVKMSDVPCCVLLCGLMHRRYSDFSPALLENYRKQLPRKKDDSVTNPSKLRVDLRLFAELIVQGVLPEKESLGVLGVALNILVQTDKQTHSNAPIITAFARYCGEDYIDAQQRLTDSRALFDRLKQLVMGLGDWLNVDMPDLTLPNDTHDDSDALVGGVHLMQLIGVDVTSHLLSDVADAGALWEDEESRVFYECFTDLKALLPGILYKDSEKATLEPIRERLEDVAVEDNLDPNNQVDSEAASSNTIEDTEESAELELEDNRQSPAPEQSENNEIMQDTETVEDNETEDTDQLDADEQPVKSAGAVYKALMDEFEKQLPQMVNRKMVDTAAEEFTKNMNTKQNRRRLVRCMIEVPRTRLDLLPFYARFVRVMQSVFPDLATELVTQVLKELRHHIMAKNQVRIESKLKCCRYMSELTKFGVCPKSETLSIVQKLLFDLRHHNIDMVTAVLEGCGLFLYRSPASHQKTKILIETMLRKRKNAVGMEQRYQLMIDNAYYQCNPSSADQLVRVQLPVKHQFIEQILFSDLSSKTVPRVLRLLRRVDWTDTVDREFAMRALASAHRCKYSTIQYLACLVAGIMSHQEWLGYAIMDTVLEDIRLGLEINHSSLNQRRLAAVKYLAELYCYRVIDSSVVFNTLYAFITVAADPVSTATEKSVSTADPPEHLFRIRLACELLETCGEYFDRGMSKRKLECYLLYLQRYYWLKKSASIWSAAERPFPMECDFLVLGVFEKLRPKTQLCQSLQEAQTAVDDMEAEYKDKVEELLKHVSNTDTNDTQMEEEEYAADRGLNRIEEGEEDEDAIMMDQHFSGSGSASPFVPGVSNANSEYEDDDIDDDVHVTQAKHQAEAEDDLFVALFDRLVTDSVQGRSRDQVQSTDMSIPPQLRDKLYRRATFADGIDGGEVDEGSEQASPEHTSVNANALDMQHRPTAVPTANTTVMFGLMTKGKGNKPQIKSIRVSEQSDLARGWHAGKAAELREQQSLKKLTLNIAGRMAQEEENADLQSFRGNLQAFQPPKQGRPAPPPSVVPTGPVMSDRAWQK